MMGSKETGTTRAPVVPAGGASERHAGVNLLRPTHDQIYLAEKLDLSPAAVVKLNGRFGPTRVTDALRMLRGFPPELPVNSPYAYLAAICTDLEENP